MPDLVAANEATAGSGAFVANPNPAPSQLVPTPIGSLDAAANFPDALGEVVAFATAGSGMIVACDPRSGDIVELNSSTGAEIRRDSVAALGFPGRVAGCWSDDLGILDSYYFTLFGDRRIVTVDAGLLDSVLTVGVDPGPIGLAGVTEGRLEDGPGDEERPRYWALAPGLKRLLGVDRDTGAVLEQYVLPLPFTEVAIDDDREIAYFGMASSRRVWSMPMTFGVASPALSSFDLASRAPGFAALGVRALCWNHSGGQGLVVLGTDGTFAGVGDPQLAAGAPTIGPTPLRLGRRVASLATNSATGALLALDLDGQGRVTTLNAESGALLSTFSTLAARSGSFADFEPRILAYDPIAGEILLADARRPLFAIFGTAGDFRGHASWIGTSAETLLGSPATGLAVDPATGELLALGKRGVVRANRSGAGASLVAATNGLDASGLALDADGKAYALAPEAERVELLAGLGGQPIALTGSTASATGGARLAGATFRASDGALLVSSAATGEIFALRLDAPAAAADWALYE
jgi:hypothetical protein